MNAIKQWYGGLESREKVMVSVLGVAMILLLLTVAVVMPLKQYYGELQSDVEYYESNVMPVAEKVGRLKSSNPVAAVNVNQPLRQVATSSAAHFGLKFSNVDMNSKKTEVTLRLDNADFNQLMMWISTLEQQKGLRVDSFRASENDDAGRVSASLKLTR